MMDMFGDILGKAGALIFVFVAIGFCIVSHEFGHFLAAKLLGLHVDAFSLGFRPVWRKKYKGVEYRLGWLLFGGYVELPQIDSSDDIPKAADGHELRRAKPYERVITAFAGPLFNILSGLLIGIVVWCAGIPQDTPKMREITVLSVPENSPEYRAGLRKNDVIVKVNGEKFFLTWSKFVEKMLYSINGVDLEIRRAGKTEKIHFVPAENPAAPEAMRREHLPYPFFRPLIPIVLYPEKGSAAERAGVKEGDILISANGELVNAYSQLSFLFSLFCGREVAIEVRRNGQIIPLAVTPEPLKLTAGEAEELSKAPQYYTGITMQQNKQELTIAEVVPGSPASQCGLKAGDVICRADGKAIREFKEFKAVIAEKKTAPFEITVQRAGKPVNFSVSAVKYVPATIGVSFAVYDYPTPWQQFYTTLEMSWKGLRGIAVGIGNKLGVTQKQSALRASHMSGPLGIGMMLFTSIRTSPLISVYLVVVVSFALAIFNLLPLPVLDGGHIFFGLLEMVTRRAIPMKVMKVLYYFFAGLLIALMLFATMSDGKRLYDRTLGNSAKQGEAK